MCGYCFVQGIGDKQAAIRTQQDALQGAGKEKADLEARRNGLADERKEKWRAEEEADRAIAKMKADREKAQKKVGGTITASAVTPAPHLDTLATCWLLPNGDTALAIEGLIHPRSEMCHLLLVSQKYAMPADGWRTRHPWAVLVLVNAWCFPL